MAIRTLADKFARDIDDTYDAEHRFLEAMREMLPETGDFTLRALLEEHIELTRQHVRNLERIARHVGRAPERVPCEAAAGLVAEGRRALREATEGPYLHDSLVAAELAKVEHYEIACYRGMIAEAELMGSGRDEVLQLLRETLRHEERTAGEAEQIARMLVQKAEAVGTGGGPDASGREAIEPRADRPRGDRAPTGGSLDGLPGAGIDLGAGAAPGVIGAHNAVAAGLGRSDGPARSIASPDEVAAGIDQAVGGA